MNTISIYGAGRLTESLLRGLCRTMNEPIRICNRTPEKIEQLKSVYPKLHPVSVSEIVQEKTFLFCIVPAQAALNLDDDIVFALRKTGSILISCANGLSLSQLNKKYEGVKILRLLPNINWQICQGVALYEANSLINDNELSTFLKFMEPVATLSKVKSEKDFDTIGTLITCSPGLISEAIHQILNQCLIRDELQKELFFRSLLGTLNYIVQGCKIPEEIVEEVAVPGGLTEVGIKAMRDSLPTCLKYIRDKMDEKIEQRKSSSPHKG